MHDKGDKYDAGKFSDNRKGEIYCSFPLQKRWSRYETKAWAIIDKGNSKKTNITHLTKKFSRTTID
jgi:hypothetical protein